MSLLEVNADDTFSRVKPKTSCEFCCVQWGYPAPSVAELIQRAKTTDCLGCKLLCRALDSWVGEHLLQDCECVIVVRARLVTIFRAADPFGVEWSVDNCWGIPDLSCEVFYEAGESITEILICGDGLTMR